MDEVELPDSQYFPNPNHTIRGRIDLVLVEKDEDGGIRMRIIEMKRSKSAKVGQLYQLAAYRLAIENYTANNPISIFRTLLNSERVTFHLLTRDEDGAPQNPLEIEGKSLGREVSVLRSWMEPSGRFDEIQSNDIENVEYNLGLKCGMCIRQFECFETANAPLDVSGLTSSKLLALPAFVDEQLRHENLESLEDLSQAD